MRLSNEQWEKLEPYFPKRRVTTPKGGRPGYADREILQGILWILRVGARWGEELPLPRNYPSGSTCYRHFKKWVELGIFEKVIRALVEDLRARGKIDLTETFIDATFVEAKKGAIRSVQPSAARALKSWQSSTVDLFLSPCLLNRLHHMRVSSLCQRFGPAIAGTYLAELSETKLTILMSLGKLSADEDASSLLPTSAIENVHQLKMADLYDATDEDGWLNDSFPGSRHFDA
jgi:transposase